jgi:hypothetical protein
LNGADLNQNSDQSPSRWVINFFDWPKSKAQDYQDCFEIVAEEVKPQRMTDNRKSYREKWWQFAEKRPDLYSTIRSMDRVICATIVTKYLSFVFEPTDIVFAHRCCIIALEDHSDFAILQSNLHEAWARYYSSTLESRINYSPSDCFETFPFPRLDQDNEAALSDVGRAYYELRQDLMEQTQLGLTKAYNLFHDPDTDAERVAAAASADLTTDEAEAVTAQIANLRAVHARMDQLVLSAYGWDDVDLEHDFHAVDFLPENDRIRYTISKRARKVVLRRLLELNFERHAEEAEVPMEEIEGYEVLAEKSG